MNEGPWQKIPEPYQLPFLGLLSILLVVIVYNRTATIDLIGLLPWIFYFFGYGQRPDQK
jgi:hypothetical protein